MHKNFLVLILCSLFAVSKTEALCCFRKKAVRQPAAAERPDQALKAAHFWLREIEHSNSVVGRMLQRPGELRDAQDKLQKAVKEIKSDEAYREFIEKQNSDVLWKSETQLYADDKEEQDKEIEAAWPGLPKGLSALITDYLWQQGNGVKVCRSRGGNHVEHVIIVDKRNKHHALTSSVTRAVFDSKNIASLRFITPDHLRALAALYGVTPKPADPEEDENLEKLMRKREITDRLAELDKRQQLWVVPSVDDPAEEQKIDA